MFRAIFNSLLFGFGASAGRDIYKASKKNFPALVVLLALVGSVTLPFLGGRELAKRHDRGFIGTVMKTLIGSFALISLGFLSAFLVTTMVFAIFSDTENVPTEPIITVSILVSGVPMLFGVILGLIQRHGPSQPVG